MIGMDVSTIVSIVGSIGFPIVMCLLMYKQQNDLLEPLKDAVEELIKAIKEKEN